MPTIANQFVRIMQTGGSTDLTVCDILNSGSAPINVSMLLSSTGLKSSVSYKFLVLCHHVSAKFECKTWLSIVAVTVGYGYCSTSVIKTAYNSAINKMSLPSIYNLFARARSVSVGELRFGVHRPARPNDPTASQETVVKQRFFICESPSE